MPPVVLINVTPIALKLYQQTAASGRADHDLKLQPGLILFRLRKPAAHRSMTDIGVVVRMIKVYITSVDQRDNSLQNVAVFDSENEIISSAI